MVSVEDYGRWRNLPQMFFERSREGGDAPFLWAKREGVYRPRSWREVATQVRALAATLRRLGVAPGDRVVLLSENRPEWLIADFAIMAAGAVTVPVYTTNTPGDHLHVLGDSGATAAIVSTPALYRRFLPAALQVRDFRFVVAMEDPGAPAGSTPPIHRWEEAVSTDGPDGGGPDGDGPAAARDDVACLIYTSGTGGSPKGVMLTHGGILSNCAGAFDVLAELGLGEEVFLSFLPLSHAYEHTAGLMFPTSLGAQIYYAEGVETLAANMAEARPTIMTAVPRLYETLHQRILRQVAKQGRQRRWLLERAVALGRRRYETGRLSAFERALDRGLDRLVRARMRERFGGRLKAMVSGGAPLAYEVGIFFHALGLRILQGYGQTEASPLISCNRPFGVRLDTVGPPLPGVELRIAEDGEILVRGEMVMKGYWNNPTATAAALRDGWLHTGDVGEFDGEGRLRITDRKKDIIVNSGGDNISPARVEGLLTLEPEIAQAAVFGDRRPYIVALLVPDAEFVAQWAARHARAASPAEICADPEFHRELSAVVERVNRHLSVVERVRRFAVVPDPFTIENGMMTPTLKVRRHAVRETHGDRIDALYGA